MAPGDGGRERKRESQLPSPSTHPGKKTGSIVEKVADDRSARLGRRIYYSVHSISWDTAPPNEFPDECKRRGESILALSLCFGNDRIVTSVPYGDLDKISKKTLP